MASRTIKNHVHIFDETVIHISKVNSVLPMPVKPEVLQRWMRRGINGAVLETALVGKMRVTSKEAVQRFLAAINGEQGPARQPVAKHSPDIKAKKNRYQLPEPGRNGVASSEC